MQPSVAGEGVKELLPLLFTDYCLLITVHCSLITVFDWRVADDEKAELPDPPPAAKRSWRFWLGTAVFIIALILIGWLLIRSRLVRAEEQLKQEVQTILELQHQAFLKGDGELFFSFLPDDPAWQMAQLLPENQAAYRAGLQVTRAEQHDSTIWANVTWTAENQTWQRIAFFQWQGGRLLHVSNVPDYWGKLHRTNQEWGIFEFYDADAAWAVDIVSFVNGVVADLCTADCERRYPFTLTIQPGFQQTAETNRIFIPSPRLLALNEAGKPAPLFWQLLRQRLEAQLTPATIRFAVPAETAHVLDYEQAATDFMAVHPNIRVEIVPVETATPELLTEVDGVAIPPTADLIAAGWVMDLTDFVQTDSTFQDSDFPPQTWFGVWWEGRIWFVPQAAKMRLVFYDTDAYQQAALAEPGVFTTWDDIERDVNILLATQTADSFLEWGFLDVWRDSLYAYAASWEIANGQPEQEPLSTQSVIAALEWYRQTAGQLQPDLTTFSEAERANLLLRWQSARRRAILWVDEPVSYEHRLQLAPLGVTLLPGVETRSSITPLTLYGSFISQYSQRPLATWEWLKFLSHQPPLPRYRYLPARFSVLESSHYWDRLPDALRFPVQAAFPTARPIWIEEQGYFSWEVLTAVRSKQLSPAEVDQIIYSQRWFNLSP